MSDLRKAARQALWAFQCHVEQTWPIDRSTAAIAALRAALAQQDEPAQQTRKDGHYSVAYRCECGHKQNVTEIVRGGRTYAGSGANWCDGCGDGPPVRVDAIQQQAEPDLSLCPQCNGPADNGHDRSIPPNPYLCTRCMAEPVHKCPNCASLEAQNTELDLKLAELERAIGKEQHMTCPECEYHKQRANRWRHEAYRQGGTPLPWSPDEALLKQALAFTMRDFATVRDFEAARAVLHDALRERLKEKE